VSAHNHEKHEGRLDITIETLSSPPVKIPPAPLLKRLIAAFIDSIILSLTWLILASVTSLQLSKPSIQGGLLISVIVFLYYLLSEGIFATTFGTFVMKLRVVGRDGDPCSFKESFKRNLLRFIDWLPALYLVGGVSVFLSSNRQRIGDKFAGTIVSTVPARDSTPPPAPFLFH
jgi:uncharacterized RDD family membrane protein YckC